MSQKHLTAIWTAVGLFLVYYTLNAWICSTRAEPIFGTNLFDKRKVPGAVISIPIIAVLLIVVAEVGRIHALRAKGTTWHKRLPVIGLNSLDTSKSEGKLYQAFFFLIILVLPIFSLIHFSEIVVTNGKVIPNVIAPAKTHPSLSWPSGMNFFDWQVWNDGYRIGEETAKPQDSVTWLPVLEPIIFAILMGAALISVLRLYRALTR